MFSNRQTTIELIGNQVGNAITIQLLITKFDNSWYLEN